MIEDRKGFLYPNINADSCIDCKLCFKVCNSDIELKKNLETYIEKHANEKTLLASQSGGGFTAISN